MATADPSQIESIILNLAVNARDAIPGGGRLTISTANVPREERSKPTDLAPGDYVRVSVRDTGSGMIEEVLKKAFEPFFATKPVGSGTGLGLSQVYGIAKQSGGAVSINTTLGQGTTADVRQLAVTCLQSLGYRVVAVGGGQAAIDTIEDRVDVDLVLMDVAMPEIDGVEAMCAILAKRPGLAYLYMTGYVGPAKLDSYRTSRPEEAIHHR